MLLRIAALSAIQRRLLARALWRLAGMRVALWIRSLDALHRSIEQGRRRDRPDFTPQEAAWAVRAVARRVPGTHCLVRSLALHALLRDAGFDSELRIGVARDGTGIAAHAWVRCGGEDLEEGAVAADYVSLGSLPR